MNCLDVQTRLSDYLDGKVPESEASALEAHLAGCSACRAELAVLRQADQVLSAMADPPVDEARLDLLWAGVESRLEAEVAPQPAADVLRPAVEPAYLADAPVLLAAAPRRERWLVPVLVAGGVATVAAVVLALSLVWGGRSPAPAGARRIAQRDRAGQGDGARGGAHGKPDRATSRLQSADDAANRDRAAAGDRKPSASLGAGSTMGAAASMGSDEMRPSHAAAMGRARLASSRPSALRSRPMARSSRAPLRSYGGAHSARRRQSARPASRPQTRPASGSKAGGGGSSLTALLSAAGGGGGAATSAGGLPQRLSSGDIRRGVGRVIGSARACYNRYRVAGTCRIRVTISGATGRPTRVRVLGQFAGTPTGRCVERAFRRARFRRFRSARQSFVFPMLFR